MSLLDRGPGYEPTTVFLEEVYTDSDGNTMTRASTTPTPATARWQRTMQQGVSARKAEAEVVGFVTESIYEVRFPRSFPHVLGSQAQVRRDNTGDVFGVFGEPARFTGSRRTSHITYTVWRS